MSKVSVIVPCYNVEQYVSKCLDSLINQTLSDIEIICVDDKSTDSTLKILKQYATQDSRIKLVEQQKNGGLSNARNVGLEVACGDYIGFVDSDDYVDLEFYEKLYEKCRTNGSDIACGVLRVVGPQQTYNIDKHPSCLVNDLSIVLSYITNGSVCSKLFNCNLFKKIRFPSGLYYEDNLTLLELLFCSNLVSFDDTVFYYYRLNPNSIIHDDKKHDKRVRDSLKILSKINELSKMRSAKEADAVKRTFLKILFMRTEYLADKNYRRKLNKIFGRKYIKSFMLASSVNKIINKIRRFIFRIQNGRVKIFKITVYKIKG